MRFWFFLFFLVSSCFKNNKINQNALIHQKACIEALEIKDSYRAKTHCELCLEYDRYMPECLNGLGLIYLLEKDEEKAKTYFKRAIRQNNNFSDARNNMGVVFFINGDFKKALEYFNKSLYINPSNLDARYNSGLSNFRLSQSYKAKEDIKNALRHLSLAKDQLEKLVALEPNYSMAFRDLGLIYLHEAELSIYEEEQRELLKKAKQNFEICLKVDESLDGCHEGLGLIYLKRGQYKEAFASYFQCIAYSQKNIACKKAIVDAYEKSIMSEEGFMSFENSIVDKPNNYLAHEAFCALLFERGLNNDAQRECEIALRLKPDLCMAHFRLADHFAAILDADLAIKHCHAFLLCDKKMAFLSEQKKCEEILVAAKRG